MSLCLACGFCCDGTLFSRLPLTPAEASSLEERLRVVTGGSFAPQPCAGLNGTACTLYAERPLTCRRYRCLLLEAHEGGEVSLAEATGIVEAARTLRRALAAAVGTHDSGEVVAKAEANGAALSPEAADRLAQLTRHLRFHFVGQRAQRR